MNHRWLAVGMTVSILVGVKLVAQTPPSLDIRTMGNDFLWLPTSEPSTAFLIKRSNSNPWQTYYSTPATYDSAPTAVLGNNILQGEGPVTRIWTCSGNDGEHDTIWMTIPNASGTGYDSPPQKVLGPTNSDSAPDGFHTCAPSVVFSKNSYSWAGVTPRTDGLPPGRFWMFYECAPRLYNSSSGGSYYEAITEICMARSSDGIIWEKYATPVVQVAAAVQTNCVLQRPSEATNWRYIANQATCVDFQKNYGVGHPSAMLFVRPEDGTWWLRLYYLQSEGDGQMNVYYRETWNGINWTAATRTARLWGDGTTYGQISNPMSVKYQRGPITGLSGSFGQDNGGLFIGLLSLHDNGSGRMENYYAFSANGIDWRFPDVAEPTAVNHYIGMTMRSNSGDLAKCTVNGKGTLIADDNGWLFYNVVGFSDRYEIQNITVVSAEGYHASTGIAGHPACQDTDGVGQNYTDLENQVRGISWGIGIRPGTFKLTPQ